MALACSLGRFFFPLICTSLLLCCHCSIYSSMLGNWGLDLNKRDQMENIGACLSMAFDTVCFCSIHDSILIDVLCFVCIKLLTLLLAATTPLTKHLSVAIIDSSPALANKPCIKREDPPDPRVSTVTPATISFFKGIVINARNSSCDIPSFFNGITIYVYLLCFLLITHTVKLQKSRD